MKTLTVNPFNDKKQIFAFYFDSGLFLYFSFNSLRKPLLAVLTTTRQDIPFLFTVIQLYSKQFSISNDNCLCRSAYLPRHIFNPFKFRVFSCVSIIHKFFPSVNHLGLRKKGRR